MGKKTVSEVGEKESKVTYDGRQTFHPSLQRLEFVADTYYLQNNTAGRFRAIRSYWRKVRPYIKRNIREDIDNKIRVISNKLNSNVNQKFKENIMFSCDEQLTDIFDMIVLEAKDIILPTQSDADELIDWEEFKRKSDL